MFYIYIFEYLYTFNRQGMNYWIIRSEFKCRDRNEEEESRNSFPANTYASLREIVRSFTVRYHN